MKKFINLTMALAVVFCLASCGTEPTNNAPYADPTARANFGRDYEKVREYMDHLDFDKSRELLDEMVSQYDLSAPTDGNIGFLLLLSHLYYENAEFDRIRNNEDLIEKSMVLARKAYAINRDSAANMVHTHLDTPYYLYLLKKYVE